MKHTIASLQKNKKDLANLCLTTFNLVGIKWDGAVLDGATLQEVNLIDARLDEAILTSAHIRNSYGRRLSFNKADLVNFHLEGVTFNYVNFVDAHTSHLVFQDCFLSCASFKKNNIWMANFSKVRFFDSQFKICEISHFIIHNCVFEKASFVETWMRGESSTFQSGFKSVSFLETLFNGVNVFKTEFSHCRWDSVQLVKSTFRSVDFVVNTFFDVGLSDSDTVVEFYSHFLECRFRECRFTSNTLNRLIFGQQTRFDQAIFSGSVLEKVTFKDAQLTNSFFDGVYFYDCVFQRVVFSEVSLRGAHFLDCVFEEVEFSKCKVNGMKIEASHLECVTFPETSVESISFATNLSGSSNSPGLDDLHSAHLDGLKNIEF